MIQRVGQAAVAAPLAAHALGQENGKPPIKIGQIGVGHAHATKLSVYRKSSDYDVVGIVEPDPDLRKRLDSHPAFRGVPVMTQRQSTHRPAVMQTRTAAETGFASPFCDCEDALETGHIEDFETEVCPGSTG